MSTSELTTRLHPRRRRLILGIEVLAAGGVVVLLIGTFSVSYSAAAVLVSASALTLAAMRWWRRLWFRIAGGIVVALVAMAACALALLHGSGGGPSGVGGPPQSSPFTSVDVVVQPAAQADAFTVTTSAVLASDPGKPLPPALAGATGTLPAGRVTVRGQAAGGALLKTVTLPGNGDVYVTVASAGGTKQAPVCYSTCPPVHVVLRDFPSGTFQEAKAPDAPPVHRQGLKGEEDVEWTQSGFVDEVRFSYRTVAVGGSGGLAVGAFLRGVGGVATPVWAVVGIALTTFLQRFLGDLYEAMKHRVAPAPAP